MTDTADVKAMAELMAWLRKAKRDEIVFTLEGRKAVIRPDYILAEHADLLDRLSAQAQGSGTERGSLVDHLCEHWLQSIVCNHDAKTDRAVCWCGWTSDEQPNVGSAVRAWVDHSLPRSLAETIIPSSENMDARFEWLQSKAADMGYVLTPEPEHPDSPHAHPSAGPAVREEGLPYGIIDPDYAAFFTVARLVAWSYGYGVGLHGSFTRDLDLILVPWTDRANPDPDHVLKNIESRSGWKRIKDDGSKHPHGRLVWTLTSRRFECPRFIDIGFMPLTTPDPQGPSEKKDDVQTRSQNEKSLSTAASCT